jgi:hypothetical protein
MKNARFWTYCNGQHTKLTLKPEQTLDYDMVRQTEEGYEFLSETYDYDSETGLIHCDTASGGRDCDGTIYHHQTFVCHVDDLQAGNKVEDENGGVFRFPNWHEKESYQRDPQAEAAGY